MDRPFDFDALAQELARGLSRREALRRLAGGFAGALLATLSLPRVGGADPGGGNSACAHWCNSLPPGGDTDHCASDAAHGQGLCYQCGPAAPAGHPDLCSLAGLGATCCPSTAPNCCSGRCTNVLGDSSNCGQCGMACADGESCLNGECTADCLTCTTLCPPPRFRCGPVCCPVGGDCEIDQGPNGRLLYTCACPADQCGTVCVDFQTDASNCSGCGVTCAAGQSCVAGQCTCTSGAACPGGQSCCSGVCANTQSDPNNCGGCGRRCGRGQSCCSGVCTDLTSDSRNCGACGSACPAGQSCCGGTCIDTSNDRSNCGTCGHQCSSIPLFATCCNGVCCLGSCCNDVCCGLGQTCCNGTCVSTQSDPNNCGACFNSCFGRGSGFCCGGVCCPSHEGCCSGVCCPPGEGCCSGTCTNVRGSDRNNCGACGNVCPSVQNCLSGQCVCPPASNGDHQILCSGQCVNPLSDSNNCDFCGNACGPGRFCSNGSCV